MRSHLDELRDRYEQVLAGTAIVDGNKLVLYDYDKVECRLSEDIEFDLYDKDYLQYRRDEFEDISRIDLYAALFLIRKHRKEDEPDVEDGSSSLSVEYEEDCDEIYYIGDVTLMYFKNQKLIIDSQKLRHPIAEQFTDIWRKNLKATHFAIIDKSMPPF